MNETETAGLGSLDGVLVVDLSRALAGPTRGRCSATWARA